MATPPTAKAGRWAGGVCALILLALGCAAPPTTILVDVDDLVVYDDAALVVPGTRWRATEDANGWSFRNRARLIVLLPESGGGAFTLHLKPDAATAGQPIEARLVGGGSLPIDADGEDDGASWRLALGELPPGRHEVELRRRFRRPAPGETVRHDNVFSRLAWRRGDAAGEVGSHGAGRDELIARFLQQGVTGDVGEVRSGTLFAGPGARRIELDTVPTRAAFTVASLLAGSPAVVTLTSGEATARVELAPGESGELTLDEPSADLELRVDGDEGGVFLWSLPRIESRVAEAPPPIVLVTLDTTRRDAVWPYSGDESWTPRLAEMARTATVFEDAQSTAPWTLPSHASIFTGLYPSRHGAGVRDVRLEAGAATLARLLRRRGYATAGISAGELSSSRFGLAQGFHAYRDPDRFDTPGEQVAEYADELVERLADLPFFLFVNYFDPHIAYQAPAEYEERAGVPELRQALDEPVWRRIGRGEIGAWREAIEGRAEITPAARDFVAGAYRAEIAWTDHLVGRLLDRLRALDLYDRALIIVTSDHGELLGEGGFLSHGARLDPELTEIPLIVKWPGQRQGRRVAGLTSLIDLYPTVLAAAGLEPPVTDGRPLEPDAAPQRRYLLLEEHEALVHPLPENMKVARHLFGLARPAFRQLVWEGGNDCRRRQGEAWADVACPAEAEELLAAIHAELAVEELDDEPAGPLSDELEERLKALGYL